MDRFKRNLSKLSGKHSVRFTELMPDSFMKKYTQFPNLQAMLDAGGIEEPAEINDEDFSQFVAEHSQFDGWREMLNKGFAEYAKRTLHS
jgi:hypothetical protein